ncbi:MAG: winged helix-turn-helix domain-containing protein [Desulfovibrio sp.]|jgi:DNA-binding transcriptional MocR family regulator|nr:winged helix-turn-helix domain-containing protein [Desulfovibrio sp.]
MFREWQPDRTSKVSLCAQLSDYLRFLIKSGKLRPNSKIPGQRQLMEIFAVSRTTIIAALESLICEGLLITHPKSSIKVANIGEPNTNPEWQLYFSQARFRPSVDGYKYWSQRGAYSISDWAAISIWQNISSQLFLAQCGGWSLLIRFSLPNTACSNCVSPWPGI